MDVKRIRLLNLKALVAAAGTTAALAQTIGTNPSYLSQILTGVKTKGGSVRGVGDDLARQIERSLGKGKGWMDHLHDGDESTPAGIIDAALLADTIERVELEYPHWTVRQRAEFVAEVYLFAVEPTGGPSGAPPLNRIFNLMKRVK